MSTEFLVPAVNAGARVLVRRGADVQGSSALRATLVSLVPPLCLDAALVLTESAL